MTWFFARRLLGLVLRCGVVFTASFLLMLAVPGGPYSAERNLPPELEANFKHRYRPICRGTSSTPLISPRFDRRPWDEQPAARFSVNQVIKEGLPISASLGILRCSFYCAGVECGHCLRALPRFVCGLYADVAGDCGYRDTKLRCGGSRDHVVCVRDPDFPGRWMGNATAACVAIALLGVGLCGGDRTDHSHGNARRTSQDYVRTAKAKGLSEFKVALRHALPTALFPLFRTWVRPWRAF